MSNQKREDRITHTCPVIGANGPNQEPIRCAYEPGHDGPHSISSLPTFSNGFTALERAAIEFVEASSSDEYALHLNDPKHPAWQRRMDAFGNLSRLVNYVAPSPGSEGDTADGDT
jgi:hypothetical protein